MATKHITISASTLKKDLTAFGVKVLSCKQVNRSVSAVVPPSEVGKLLSFFEEAEIKNCMGKPVTERDVNSRSPKYVEFCGLCMTETV